MLGSSMKTHNVASGVESHSVLFQISQSTMGDLCLSRPGGGGESHCPPAVQGANGESSRALVESWSEVLPPRQTAALPAMALG